MCPLSTTTTAARKKGWTLELKIYNILYILRKKLPGSGVAAALMTGKNKFKLSMAGERRRRRRTGARTSRLFVLSTEVAGQGRRIIIKLMTLYANNGPNIATSNGFVHTAHRSTLGSAATGWSALELDCSFHIMMYYQP